MKDFTESIDLIVTSPPYCVGKEYEKDVGIIEYWDMIRSFYSAANNVLKPGGYLVINFGDFHNSKNRFYNSEVTSTYPAAMLHWTNGFENHFSLQATRIWAKQHARVGLSFVCNKRPRPAFDFEHIWTWRKPGNEGEEWVNNRALSQRGVLGQDWKSPARLKVHCAAFPIELPTWAIKVYTKDDRRKDSVVMDPFMGSGTTIVAAINEDCQYVGIEKDEEYFKTAEQRILSTQKQLGFDN